MPEPALAPLEKQLPAEGTPIDADVLLECFLAYTEEIGLEMYPAQEEAILELFAGNSVVLNTPTGSGKSLVALAACFKALAERRFAFYTAPIKALVSEKFFELCKVLGPQNVGMMTGDASVNRDAPIICCTAEILANLALREGAQAEADWVVMDEFHYYSDRDRGVAWQLPLLALPQARFLLMSATLGKTDFFIEELEKRTGAPAKLVKSTDRPVPLDWEYSEKPLQETILSLSESGKVPIYIVHFSQRAASEQAQNLMSVNFLDKDAKEKLKNEVTGFGFDSPFGKELRRYVLHGVGVHHAGMLPKYRRLVERLAQQGLLHVICGTDTLGVGVNVPIRTVLFTQLCKFDGQNTAILTVRDFHQIAGRAGRRGFDTQGSVVVQAPEHEIENKLLKQKAEGNPKKMRKLRLRKAPERGYAPWNENTLTQLRESSPEPLVSRFVVNHGMLLNVLAGDGGCMTARKLLRQSHETEASKRALLREGVQLFKSLVSSEILSVKGAHVDVNADLQQDFSLNQALALYAVEALDALDKAAPDYALVLLSVVESILENPNAVLYKQVDLLKSRKVAEMKADGVEYDDRMAELEKIEYPKPEAEFIYESYNLFAKHHPWVTGYNIAPKSVARDMHELAASFNDYVKEYGLARSEGVLLRYLTDVYRALRQTVPEKHKTDEVWDLEEWLGAELRSVDASLIDEWERLQHPEDFSNQEPTADKPKPAEDITRNTRAFSIMVRNACFRVLQALAQKNEERAIDALLSLAPAESKFPKDAEGEAWTPGRLKEALSGYYAEYDAILLNADARSAARCSIQKEREEWQVRQALSDPEGHLEWALNFTVDLATCIEENRVVVTLARVGQE